MKPFTKKLFGIIALLMLAVADAVMIIAWAIGLTTTADDAEEKIPKLLLWLMNTPWWVPAFIIPGALVAVMVWAFWPDRSVERAMREYKASNDRAWEFEPEFRAKSDALAASQVELRASHAAISEEIAGMRDQLTQMEENVSAKILKSIEGKVEHRITIRALSVREEALSEALRAIDDIRQRGEQYLLGLDKMYRHSLEGSVKAADSQP